MATVGQSLLTPEVGWKRYDDNNGNISYSTGWDVWSDSHRYGGSCHFTTQVNASLSFKFYGTKLRLISGHGNDHPNTNSIQVKIDGAVVGSFSQYHISAIVGMVLSFELLGLEQKVHEVEIISTSFKGNIDAIDIDENGYLCHPVLNTVGSLDNMQVGDCIPCKYTAASGANGVFSNFGTGDINDIPVDGTDAPNGNFFFIKVDKGLLIADRVLQHSISWNTLNLAGRIEHGFFIPIVMYLPMDESSGNIVIDATGVNNGTVTGATIVDGYNGGKARHFQNVADRIDFSSKVFPVGKKSIRFKFRAPIPTGSYPLALFDTAALGRYNGDTILIFNPGLIEWRSTIAGWSVRFMVESTINVCDNKWHDVLLTWDGTTNANAVKMYIDDMTKPNSTATASSTDANAQYNLRIGYNYDPYPHQYQYVGDIDEVEVYSEVITPDVDPKRPLIVRSLTGGVAYADENGNPVLTDRNYGGFPTDNEWDKYIINSNLDGKIQPGDNNIWHYANKASWVKETSLTGLVNPDGSVASAGTFRNIRGLTARPPFSGGFGSMIGTNANIDVGFRPVLEYIEPDGSSKQETIWR